jgi:hypothetical protein
MEDDQYKVKIPFLFTIDDCQTWDNHPIIKFMDEVVVGSEFDRKNKETSAKARLDRYKWECKTRGKSAIDEPNVKGIIESF